ncbi:MAG: hypothetical protein QXL86_00525 [Candidatus Aenigmatarchaeota archaeon]
MEKTLEWLTLEEKIKKLSINSAKVFEVISRNWPTNPLEVAKFLGDDGDKKSLSAKYLYHFKKLYKFKLIRMKKIGNTYIAWPIEIEKLRIMKEFLSGV